MYLLCGVLQESSDSTVWGSIGDVTTYDLVFVYEKCGVDGFSGIGVIRYPIYIAHNGFSGEIC